MLRLYQVHPRQDSIVESRGAGSTQLEKETEIVVGGIFVCEHRSDSEPLHTRRAHRLCFYSLSDKK